MIKNLLTLFFVFTLGLSLQAQNPTVFLPNLTVDQDADEFEIDVKVSNFTDLISMQYTISWDPAKLQYLDVINAFESHGVKLTEVASTSSDDDSDGARNAQRFTMSGEYRNVLTAMESIELNLLNARVAEMSMERGAQAQSCLWNMVVEFNEVPR